jgi:hypothetical protein
MRAATKTGLLGLVGLAALLSVVGLYYSGLHGPLVLDDRVNLSEISSYLEGNRTAENVIFGNRSGRLGRPVSMATFLADVELWGNSTWHAKRTNLIIHLMIGALVVWFSMLLARLSGIPKGPSAMAVGLCIGALWMLMPVHASTVLYLVQRMAQLSTLFILSGLILFLYARQWIDGGHAIRGQLALWLGVPVFGCLAAFSKENGVLLFPLALILEFILVRPMLSKRGLRSVNWFFVLSCLLPSSVVLAANVLGWISLFSAYDYRYFTPLERVLTQTRVLWDYVLIVLLPNSSNHGLFHDDYTLSTGLFSPFSTFIAIVAWAAALLIAWRVRQANRLILTGLAFFLMGHALESTVFPLEIYFEHRNYLPSIGLLLALAGLVDLLTKRLGDAVSSLRLVPVVFAALALTYGVGLLNQVDVWSDETRFLVYHTENRPDSFRMHSHALARATVMGDVIAASFHARRADEVNPYGETMAPPLWQFLLRCRMRMAPEEALYELLESRSSGQFGPTEMVATRLLAGRFEAGECPGLDLDRLVTVVEGSLQKSTFPYTTLQQWMTRYFLARMYATEGHFTRAIELGEKAWRDSDYNRGVGVFLFRINASEQNVERCREILERLEQRTGGGDLAYDRIIARFREAIEQGELDATDETEALESEL